MKVYYMNFATDYVWLLGNLQNSDKQDLIVNSRNTHLF